VAGCALILAALPAGAAPKRAQHPGLHDVLHRVERARVLMGTACTITAEGFDSTWAAGAVEDAFGVIDRLDSVLSSWRQDSELARVNAAGAERRIECSPDFYAVLDSSLAIARETEGAFDPTIEPLNRVWDMRGKGRVPDGPELGDALQRVGWTRLQVMPGPRLVRFDRDSMGLDFGGIGKGYALDRAVDLLRERRMQRVLLNFGGEIAGFTNSDPWTIEIADPSDRLRPAVRMVLRQGAVSTSGQGERFVTVDHQSFGHVLDPRLGRPVPTRATVTVVARSGTRADGLSTGLLVMGRERAGAFAEEHHDIGVLWLEPDAEGIRAWRWNLGAVSVEPGVKLEWIQ
jgi:thiamine biosynthesis lipoprotein